MDEEIMAVILLISVQSVWVKELLLPTNSFFFEWFFSVLYFMVTLFFHPPSKTYSAMPGCASTREIMY